MTTRRSSPAARRALVAAVSAHPGAEGDLGALVAVCERDELVGLALAQAVAGRASEALGSYLPPAEKVQLLRTAREETLRHFACLDLLHRLGAALESAGVAWVVLKGPALAELSYGHTPRGYSDLDLLVAPSRFKEAVRALEGAGLTFAQRNWPLMVKVARGQVTMAFKGDPSVDLHWHFVYKRSVRERFMLPTEELLGRRRLVKLGNVDAWVLEPTDFAIHIALHAAWSGAHQLRWLVDIERTMTNQPPQWDEFVRRCRAWRISLPVSVALNRARQTVGAPVPEQVVWQLAGKGFNVDLVRWLSDWAPGGHLPGQRSLKAGLTRSLHDSLAATGAEFAGEVWGTLGRLLRHEPEGSDPRALAHDS
ncbi:MAG TPA: nucleotidyltransferase family protein, partial [Acidimicrobiales bacterium]|nr:nucleotidyltransferase family protein [Acidimicrobiales bacterium]